MMIRHIRVAPLGCRLWNRIHGGNRVPLSRSLVRVTGEWIQQRRALRGHGCTITHVPVSFANPWLRTLESFESLRIAPWTLRRYSSPWSPIPSQVGRSANRVVETTKKVIKIFSLAVLATGWVGSLMVGVYMKYRYQLRHLKKTQSLAMEEICRDPRVQSLLGVHVTFAGEIMHTSGESQVGDSPRVMHVDMKFYVDGVNGTKAVVSTRAIGQYLQPVLTELLVLMEPTGEVVNCLDKSDKSNDDSIVIDRGGRPVR